MLELPRSDLIETYTVEPGTTAINVEEGSALVQILEGGIARAIPSTGAANEVFLGCAVGKPTMPTVVPYFETLTVPSASPYTRTLARTINGTDLGITFVAADGTRSAGVSGGAGANGYTLSGNTITFNSADAGKRVELRYRYNITYQEAIFRYNFNGYGVDTRTNVGTLGVCSTGRIYTDCFDLASDWASFNGSTPVKIGANGRFTLSGGGSVIDATVIQVPGADIPFLGLGLGLKHS